MDLFNAISQQPPSRKKQEPIDRRCHVKLGMVIHFAEATKDNDKKENAEGEDIQASLRSHLKLQI